MCNLGLGWLLGAGAGCYTGFHKRFKAPTLRALSNRSTRGGSWVAAAPAHGGPAMADGRATAAVDLDSASVTDVRLSRRLPVM